MAGSDSDGFLASEWTPTEKLDALRWCGVPLTPHDESFGRIVRHAAKTCGAAVAVIALSDGRALSIIAEQGLGSRTGPEEADRLLAYLVENATTGRAVGKDSLSPRQQPVPGFESLVCVTLKTPDGDPIGALGVFDRRSSDFTDEQLDALEFLADQTVAILELRRRAVRQQKLLQEANREITLGKKFEWLVTQSPEFVCAVDLQGFVVYLNEVASRMVGIRIRLPVAYELKELIADEHQDTFINEVMPIILRGEVCERRLRLHHVRTRKSLPMLFTIYPIRGPDLQLIGYGVGTKDATALEAEEERMDHLVREGAHRMQNLVAVMNSVVDSTLRHHTDIGDARVSIRKRLEALGAAQTVLGTASAADIVDVVRVALSPHDGDGSRFQVSGPSLMLTAQQTQGLALGLYELGTNAVKYGSLSNDTGTVGIQWSLSETGSFTFEWTETGGPTVSLPTSAGFGSTLLKRGIGSYFSGEIEQEFRPEGLRVALRGRLSE